MPGRSNDRWTEEEKAILTSMLASGASYVRIAAKLKRSVGAVKGRDYLIKSRKLTVVGPIAKDDLSNEKS